jgi:hypothetical protein
MNHRSSTYVQYLVNTIGAAYHDLAGIESSEASPGMVLAISFLDYPEKGLLTGFTYGLSEMAHPDWKNLSKPELTITVKSTDIHWVHAIGYLVEWHRATHAFQPGSLFQYGRPAAADSAMDSFLVFNPVVGQGDEFREISLGNDKIELMGVFPLYHDEVSLIQKIGIRKFTGLTEYSLFSVTRPDLSALYKVGGG